MNNKTKKAKKTHKFNIVDSIALIIAFVVVIAVFLWIDPFNWIKTEAYSEEKTVLYSVELRGVEKAKSALIHNNDDVVLLAHGINLGKVVEIKKAPSLRWDIPKEGNQMILMQNPTLDTLYVTIEIECLYQNGIGYFLNGERLLVGDSISLQFPMFEMVGECVSIMTKE